MFEKITRKESYIHKRYTVVTLSNVLCVKLKDPGKWILVCVCINRNTAAS